MASQLREVLNRFEDQTVPVSISQLAREMGLETGVLRGMIAYWVRKGKLREVDAESATCHTCDEKRACPFVVSLPTYYEWVREGESALAPPCTCGGHCAT